MSAGEPERDFDDVIAKDGSNNRAIIEVKLSSFRRTNDVDCSFTSDQEFKIKTNVNGTVYSKTVQGLTEEHVELPAKIEKSNKHFKVILMKKKNFSIEEHFFGSNENPKFCAII